MSTKSREDRIKELAEQYQKDIKQLLREGRFNHNSLERHLSNVINQVNEEIRIITEELIAEEQGKKRTCPICGRETRVNVKGAKTEWLTTQGMINIYRDWYVCRSCGKGFSPLDTLLGADEIGHKMTPTMAAKITYMGQFATSFEAAAECFEYISGLTISPFLIRQITEETGKKVDKQQRESSEAAYLKPEETVLTVLPKKQKSGRLYIMADGSQVNTRIKDEDDSTWKEMKLGLVYSDDHVLTCKGGETILTEKEYVAHFGCVEGFKPLLYDAAARAGYGTYKETVMIGDGAHWIWNLCDELFPDAVQVLDYYHMSENVHAYARYLYPYDNAKLKAWAETMITSIEAGKIDEALEAIPPTDESKLPSGVPKLYKYLSYNRNRMNYKELKQWGFKVGSGAIESGNKKVIQQRMKQSGMRWGVQTGQFIASLRAKYASNRWREIEKVLNVDAA